mgnify:CR=1 FL=1|tara:strand:- start:184 stop:675 length:492 start_codon:yes stop_codon:yes gene_type:complete
MRIKYFLFLIVVVMSSNCATIISGTDQEIYITSEPEGAAVYIQGLQAGVTPALIKMNKPGLSSGQLVTLKHKNYKNITFMLQKNLDIVAILNWGNIPFWIFDVFTGAIMKYDPSIYNIKLEGHEEAIDINELPLNDLGYLEVPNLNHAVLVVDKTNDLKILFK